MKKTNKRGFTIVELVIVIAVIAILATVLVPTFSGVIADANEKAALQTAKSAYSATYAKDLEDNDATNDAVYGVTTPIVVEVNELLVSIDTNGVPSVVDSGTETHTLTNGILVKNP